MKNSNMWLRSCYLTANKHTLLLFLHTKAAEGQEGERAVSGLVDESRSGKMSP